MSPEQIAEKLLAEEKCGGRLLGLLELVKRAIEMHEASKPILTDERIDELSRPFIRPVGDHWCSEDAISERYVEDFARAIEKEVRQYAPEVE